ncbi:GNAT family N-acetyltransferase [Pseudofrankia sp. DC12]|uniref:GNAT family N-acetyltransferase n=1 Tax=Pseudofrankia sp. DC12 TaxID=683315 RepID=UPI0005F85AAD|nr:GNAT family N-acetyltransferase [Pseudofrankia sp. DC12]
MTITVQPASQDDAEDLAALMVELDTFYGAPPTEDAAVLAAQIQRLLFGPIPAAYVLLAREEDRLVGMASYSYLWPAAGVTHSLFLKELYVSEAARRHGVGRLLMEHLRAIATEQGCSRVEWTTDTENTGAQAFYGALGTRVHASKVFYRAQTENHKIT